jgi:hypothetical protein
MAKRKYRYGNRFDIGGIKPIQGVSISDLVEIPTLGVGIPNSIILPNATSLPTISLGSTRGLSFGTNSGMANAGVTLANKLVNPRGNSTKAGNALSTIGSAASAIPEVGGLIGTGVNLVGGLFNTMFGSNINEEAVAQVESNIANQKNMGIGASTTSDFLNMADDYRNLAHIETSDIGSDGWFSNKASNKAKELNWGIDTANRRALANFTNTANNVNTNTINNLLANYAAYGGPITMRYTGLMSPFGNQFKDGGGIHIKKKNRGKFTEYCGGKVTSECIARGKRSSSPTIRKRATFAANARKWKHEDGGPLFTHGGIWDNGLTYINEGGSHEENPFEGVQMGVDPQGIPNLVEEGEVVYNDYVFSNRLKVPKEAKKKLKLKGTTFADAAKEINKESEERPNDPISKNGLESSMSQLMMVQEDMRAKKQRNKYAKGGRLFPDGGLVPYSNFTSIGDNFYTPEYMNFWNYVNGNRDYGQGLLRDINNGVYGDIGGNTLSYEDMMRLSHDYKRGPVHQAFINAANRNYAKINAAPIASTLSGVDNIKAPTLNVGEEMSKIKPADLRYNSKTSRSSKSSFPTWLRYAPAIGSTIGLFQGLFNKPDYRYSNAILEAANDIGDYTPVEFNPIGNYLTYRPFDRDYYINKLNAQSGATRRALMNSSGANRAAAAANLLAADYNAQGRIGDLARQAEEHNLNQRQMVESFNRGTNQFNSEGRLKADIANQETKLRARSQRLNGVTQAMAMRQAVDDSRNASIAGNFSNIFQSLGDIGREEVERAWIRDNPSLYYDTSLTGKGVTYKDKKSYGGYITRRNKKKGGRK